MTTSRPPVAQQRVAIAILLIAGIASITSPSACAQVLPSDPASRCAIAPSKIAGWFDAGAVSLDGSVKPANSLAFPDQPNCPFYEWSEQMFLWLNSPTPAGGGGRIFNSSAFFDVLPLDQSGARALVTHATAGVRLQVRNSQVGPNNLPIIFDKAGRMLEVQPPQFGPNGARLVALAPGKAAEIGTMQLAKNGKPLFFDLQGKKISPNFALSGTKALTVDTHPFVPVRKFMVGDRAVFLDQFGNIVDVEQGQAGGDSVLMSQQGSLVYYGIHVNDVFAYFATGTKNGSIVPTPTKFPTMQTELDKVTAFAQQQGKALANPEALAVEVKTAWVEATGLDTSKYVTTTATIPTYDTSDAAHTTWTPVGTKSALLAMVGMHVVGSANGHPEMIWATFEHVGNTPAAAYSYVNAANQMIAVPQDAAGLWLFSASGSTGPFNVEHMSFVAPNIVGSNGNTISPSDTLRWKAWGAASDHAPNPIAGSSAISNSEIISSNNSVIGLLLPGDVRRNYVMTGATWTIFGAGPTATNQVGTSQLANTTMETYQQSSNSLNDPGMNCFACHKTNTVSVSKIFRALSPLPLAASPAKAP